MNVSEKRMAQSLLAQLTDAGWLLGDAQYDSSRLYDLPHANGHQLVAPRRKQGSLGHHYRSRWRLFAMSQLEGGGGSSFHRVRTLIERNFGGGLSPLSAWVRGLCRVKLWAQAKLLINALRILQKAIASAYCCYVRGTYQSQMIPDNQSVSTTSPWQYRRLFIARLA